MKVHPIIFSGPMVRALLEGRKTQTRRQATSPLAKVQPGDALYVREAFFIPDAPFEAKKAHLVYYMADGAQPSERCHTGWRPSIHMPRWASRIALAVCDVRKQRLRDISEADARAEGIEQLKSGRGYYDPRFDHGGVHLNYCHTAREAFALLWDSLHGDGSFGSNPDVVALTFSVHEKNIDDFLKAEAA